MYCTVSMPGGVFTQCIIMCKLTGLNPVLTVYIHSTVMCNSAVYVCTVTSSDHRKIYYDIIIIII